MEEMTSNHRATRHPADINRNGRPTSIGTGGRLQSECPADIIGIRSRAVADPTADADIVDLQPHEIAAPEFAVDREVEQGEVAGSALHLEPDPDRPHVLRLQRALLPNKAP